MKKGLVYKSTGSWYQVRDQEGRMLKARIRGRLKQTDITSTNPVAVGDEVLLEMEDGEGDEAIITDITDRKNYITRSSPHNRNQHHIIASNLDQCLLFATLKSPKTSSGFIDRFLVTAEAYHIPAIIVFNKADLYKRREQDRLEELKEIYTRTGYPLYVISIENNTGLDEVVALLKNKTTLLSGHSGVGKSSFLNILFPGLELKTQEVSNWSGKGLHTTTFAEMFDLPGGGRVIDTPGIRELGLVDISRQELSHYYPEMRAILNRCQFNDCLHFNEPGCAVKLAVDAGEIAVDRYVSYLSILEELA